MCFSVDWLAHLAIWLVGICFIVGVLKLVLPIILGWVGMAGGLVMQVINMAILAIVIIAVIVFALDLYHCSGWR